MGWSTPTLPLTATAVSVPTVLSPACFAFLFCLSHIIMMLGLGRINDVINREKMCFSNTEPPQRRSAVQSTGCVQVWHFLLGK